MSAITDKRLFQISILIALYVAFLYLDAYVLTVHSVLIAVFLEITIIPSLTLLVFFFILSAQRLLKGKALTKTYLPIAFLILLITVFFTVGSLATTFFTEIR